MSSRDDILQECTEITNMLVRKNAQYGDSALEPISIFSSGLTSDRLAVRIDDKISRYITNSPGDTEDTVLDLIGYLILWRIAKRKEDQQRNLCHGNTEQLSILRNERSYTGQEPEPQQEYCDGGVPLF